MLLDDPRKFTDQLESKPQAESESESTTNDGSIPLGARTWFGVVGMLLYPPFRFELECEEQMESRGESVALEAYEDRFEDLLRLLI